MTGLYIHIPFCITKCPYCGFYSVPYRDEYAHDYINFIKKEILIRKETLCGNIKFDSIYIGGGTPTCIGSTLFDLINLIYKNFNIDSNVEFTVEINPGTVNMEFLEELYKIRVKRLSIGIQSLNNDELIFLGRIHTREQALKTINNAVKKGFKNISVDLIFGFPGHTLKKWTNTLDEILVSDITHLSAYEFTIEENTPFQIGIRDSNIIPLNEDIVIKLTDRLEEKTEKKGFKQYEISSFCLSGYECMHNLNYWDNGNYLGLGPSSVTYFRPKREKNVSDVKKYYDYLNMGKLPINFTESLDNESCFKETFVLSLRKKSELFFHRFIVEFGIHPINYYMKEFKKLSDEELIKYDNEKMVMTKKGWRLSNYVLSHLI